ncbi:holo-ACP synthase [Pedobacter lithocola]|uniref:Holo-[acyl-carrier-protein] synthase n=1 Tax=Pedobacter lithocola TaxID=1908239 RepID=A0ABV8PH75_9SPHI
MIVSIGTDIVQHTLNSKLLNWNSNGNLQNRILSDIELEIYNSNPSDDFVAGRFSAKEAILKCLGTGMQDGISLKDISVLKHKSGKIEVELIGQPKEIADQLGINHWHISITHSQDYSLAFVIGEKV